VPLHKSLLTRLLAASILIALGSVAATAWLAVQTTTKAIEQEHGQSLLDDSRIYDTLTGWAATHKSWAAGQGADSIHSVVSKLASTTGRRVVVAAQDRKPIADSEAGRAPIPARASAVLNPLNTNSALVGNASAGGIDARAVGPYRLSKSERSRLQSTVDRIKNCERFGELPVRFDSLPSGRIVATMLGPDTKRIAEYCSVSELDDPTPSEATALGQLNKAVNVCVTHEAGRAPVKVTPSFRWVGDGNQFDNNGNGIKDSAEGIDAGTAATESSRLIQGCIDAGRRDQLKPFVAPPALLFVSNPGNAPRPEFDLSPANTARIVGGVGLVLLLAVAVTVVVGRRLVRPLRALTAAAQRPAGLHEHVPVMTGDEIGYLAAAFNDLTDRRHVSELERKAMVSDVAHELRTPLTNIRSWLEAAQDGLAPRDPELMSLLLEEAVLLQHIIDDLRDLAAADAGNLRLHPELVHVNDLLDQVVAAHRGQADAAHVVVSFEPLGDPELNVDPVRIRQAVGNLVSNAVRYTSAGGSVVVRSRVADGRYVIEVADTGAGIAADDLAHVFDRFWRAEKSRNRQTGGSGLGLAIVRKLAEAHGGTVGVTSSLGKGTTFTIELPVG
jgi:two-component system sensor histidine kinase BaeS